MTDAAFPGAPQSSGSSRPPFNCEICLDEPVEPVVTFCGHLYCWPCLYRWLRSGHAACPTCKSGVSEATVVPLYGRGRERRPPSGEDGDAPVPSRPAARRTEAPPAHAADPWGGAARGGVQVQFAAGFGFFPSLFGLQFTAANVGRPPRAPGVPMTAEESHVHFLERVFLATGGLVLFFLLFL